MNTHRSYRNLPSLAGICTMDEAMKHGLSIEQCVARLKRYHYALKRLHQVFNNRITAEPAYELKMGFSLHAHYCAEHVAALRKRVGEMREPPLGLEEVPHPALEIFFDEILAAPSTEELLLGLYAKALPAVKAALTKHIIDTNPLTDHPSVRLCRFALLELDEMLAFGNRCIASLVDETARGRAQPWLTLLEQCLATANGLDGASTASNTPAPSRAMAGYLFSGVRPSSVAASSAGSSASEILGAVSRSPVSAPGDGRTPANTYMAREEDRRDEDRSVTAPTGLHPGRQSESEKIASSSALTRQYSSRPYRFDPVPRRDGRFPDPYNMGVNAEVFLYDPDFPPEPKTLMMFYKRLREIDVPEMMASIIAETPDKPWDYYRDMTRQLWDEARHAMMGEVGFANLNIDWPREVMVNFTWSLALNTQLKPIERHAVLYFIEQGLMPKTGKRFEWEVGVASHNPLSALFQDYDWADEVLHARIGRDWYLKEFSDARTAVQYGDQCWSKVLMNWNTWREQGKTQHRNWWPGLYRAACRTWNVQPDPRVLNYGTTYEAVRADLKDLSASG